MTFEPVCSLDLGSMSYSTRIWLKAYHISSIIFLVTPRLHETSKFLIRVNVKLIIIIIIVVNVKLVGTSYISISMLVGAYSPYRFCGSAEM